MPDASYPAAYPAAYDATYLPTAAAPHQEAPAPSGDTPTAAFDVAANSQLIAVLLEDF